MTAQKQDKFWDLIIRRIEEDKCILIIGTDLSTEKTKSLNEQLKEYLE